MIQTTIRPFTDDEREAVAEQLLNVGSAPPWNRLSLMGAVALGAWLGLLFSVLVGVLLERFGVSLSLCLGIGVVTGGVLGWRCQKETERWGLEHRKLHAAWLARCYQRGEMEEVTVTASGVVYLKDGCEEMNGYFFDIGDNKVLFLRETTLRGEAGDADTGAMVAPSSFRLKRYPDEPYEVIRVEPLGPPLTPLRTISADTVGDEYYELPDGEIIGDVSLATLEKDLPYLVGGVDK